MPKLITPRNLVGTLALLGALLLRADSSATDATCCNLAGSYATNLFPGGEGDEGFFGLPVGVPGNAMIVLDNSGSMLDFPHPLPAGPAAGTGGCSGYANLDAAVASRSATPYDNGTSNAFIVDNPPWGLAACGTSNSCLFNPSGYYVFGDWGTDWAWQYAAGSGAGQICQGAPNAVNCQTCLDNTGYYVFADAWGNDYYRFKGDFLNGYPPKFVIARKVVKDLVAIEQSAPKDADSVRYGLTVFTSGNYDNRDTYLHADDGGVLVVPLGPNCDLAQSGYLSTNSTQVAAYQEVRQAIVDAVNNPALVDFNSWTPLGETLFNVGQYFSDTRGRVTWPTTGSTGPVYDYMFGTNWRRTSFYENAAGTSAAPWVATGRQESVCWSCQQNSAIIVTDGEPTHDTNLPRSATTTNHTASPVPGTPSSTATNDFRRWTLPILTVPGCTGTACSAYTLQKVAHFLHNQDLRPDLSNAKQTQTLNVYTISFGLGSETTSGANANRLLDHTAFLGGGEYYNTSSGAELQAALDMAVTDTIARANSFSVSNTNTLQTGNNNQLVLARFRKLLGTIWEGHLLRYKIFNEYVQGCDTTRNNAAQTPVTCTRADGSTRTLNPNLNGDLDCNSLAVCDGLYMLDADCDPITEDENGDFRKATLDAATHTFSATSANTAATPFWDAGAALSYKTFPADYPVVSLRGAANPAFRSADAAAANAREIYTVLIGDGTATATNPRIAFTPANAPQLAPYMDLNGLKKVGTGTINYCAYLLERIGFCSSDGTMPACPVPDAVTNRVTAADEELCAVQVINWYRGWDVLDEDNDGCAGPGNPSNASFCPGGTWDGATSTYSGGGDGEERVRGTFTGPDLDNGGAVALQTTDDRAVPEFWKLGDIFHSSPVVVKPPVSEFVCDLGLEPQCTSTIHSPSYLPSSMPTPADYDVNGNGTIEAGENAYTAWRKAVAQRQQVVLVGANDGMLHAFDAGVPDPAKPKDLLGSWQYTDGTGEELWAFIPPDLLPASAVKDVAMDDHQYMVDGNTMVRDIWVDDERATGTKQSRPSSTPWPSSRSARGGTQYTALDVTDPTNPVFLWTFPRHLLRRRQVHGPVLERASPPARRPSARSGSRLPTPPRPDQPRLRGALDRDAQRRLRPGHGAAAGRSSWSTPGPARPSGATPTTTSRPTRLRRTATSMFPVPGRGGPDRPRRRQPGRSWTCDGFFDTATWGDLGGNLFVARFQEPGDRSAAAGRVHQLVRGPHLRGVARRRRRPAVRRQPERVLPHAGQRLDLGQRHRTMHTYLGSGNREQLMQMGGACGPNNLLGCCQAGCTVTVDHRRQLRRLRLQQAPSPAAPPA